MSTGTVKWFSNAKGYGFIAPETGGDDIFAHFSSITMEGYKTLKKGQLVEFECTQGPKGLHATEIKLSNPPPLSDVSVGASLH
ncbi:Cold shock protein of CSP family [hydrothermal vent metagenome]|uniref:Cold shock protein of CSP family n=1 Tax=hydrothermal vent metagenome TaxID=652676 RepID=A0A3B1BYR7_9ZZZZ